MEIPVRLRFRAQHWIGREEFKNKAFQSSDSEITAVYRENDKDIMSRPTDLNRSCWREILQIIKEKPGQKILDAGCGLGYLSAAMSAHATVTAIDAHIPPTLTLQHPAVNFVEGTLTALPFADKSFDTVICSHVLEHIVDIQACLRELRRVTRNQIIVVLPRERPYRYSLSAHLHYFPYEFSVWAAVGKQKEKTQTLRPLAGDWFYSERSLHE